MLKPSDYSVAWGLILFFVLGNLTGKSDLAQPNPNWDNDYVGRFPSLIPDNLFRFHSNISFMELQQYRQSVSYTNCLWIPHLRSNMNSSWWAIRLQSYLLLQKTDIAEMGSWINIVFHFFLNPRKNNIHHNIIRKRKKIPTMRNMYLISTELFLSP